MSKRTIVAMPGDGIGKAVLDETIRLLDAAGFEADYVEGDIGWEFWKSEGNPLPERTIAVYRSTKYAAIKKGIVMIGSQYQSSNQFTMYVAMQPSMETDSRKFRIGNFTDGMVIKNS